MRWLPAILWGATLVLIFYISSQAGSPENSAGWIRGFLAQFAPALAERLTDAQLNAINYAMRKTGHGLGYALLTLLGYGAFRVSFGMERARALRYAVGASFFRAILDEIHQAFVPGRTGTVVDVGIDAIGIAITAWLIQRRHPNRLTSRR
ncbi:MAG: hypothetical protein KatS3mg019_1806 [Fimbriimonadales bacterium]|nr:MAG: hypothetical protein KatS3mg019_1806 [Fimbriimonadales bacterium]